MSFKPKDPDPSGCIFSLCDILSLESEWMLVRFKLNVTIRITDVIEFII